MHKATMFTWTEKVGVVEASTLGPGYATRLYAETMFIDDIGFGVRGKTCEKMFVYDRSKYTGDAYEGNLEVIATIFKSSDGFEIHVLNT
jgi:hypothetical protein